MAADSPTEATSCCIENFRPVAGLSNVYRCASTDTLVKAIRKKSLSPEERIVVEAGLILDLRSPVERNEKDAQAWNTAFDTQRRNIQRIDVLSPSKFMDYLEKNWLSASERMQASFFAAVSGMKLHELRMDTLNGKGLEGLNEAILETGKEELCQALKMMTSHLEAFPNDYVVIHCVQGKDRTGLLAMLCQSVIGMSDEEIITDYFKSDAMKFRGSAAAKNYTPQKGKLNRRVFGGASKEVMQNTLSFLKSSYGTISPGYLDEIGFDDSWRRRLTAALNLARSKL